MELSFLGGSGYENSSKQRGLEKYTYVLSDTDPFENGHQLNAGGDLHQ